MGCAAFKEKGHTLRYCCAFTHTDGIPPATLLVELPRVDANDDGGAPDGRGGGGGGAVGSSMPIFLLITLGRLEHFLLAPSAATPCASSGYSSISTISFYDVPSKFGALVQSEQEQPRSNVVQHRWVEIFFIFLRVRAAVPWKRKDDRLLPRRPPDRSGPPRPAANTDTARQSLQQQLRSAPRGVAPLVIYARCAEIFHAEHVHVECVHLRNVQLRQLCHVQSAWHASYPREP